MCKKIAITNRHLVHGDFLTQIEKVLQTKPAALILREKDLPKEVYERLAERVLILCRRYNVPCLFNNRTELAERLRPDGQQLSFAAFCDMEEVQRKKIGAAGLLGVSVHSLEEVKEAEVLGAAFVIFGHVFETDCKPGLPPRGLTALKEICAGVSIPVYAIGGVNEENSPLCVEAGAAGVCMMSGFMEME